MSLVNDITGVGQALTDPIGFLLQGITGLMGHLISVARVDMMGVLDRFLFRTVDPTVSGNRPITANPNLASLNLGLTLAVDVLIGLVVLFTSLRSIFERSMRAKYDLKVILPRILLAIALAHGSLLLMQMAVDLNNAMDSVALSLGGPLTGDNLPWSPSLSPGTIAGLVTGQDLFQVLMALALVAAMAILVLSYVIRTALLNVLIVTAPLAALLSVIPDTRSHARTWLRLFLGTVFMQAVQLIVLRVAVTTEFDSSGGLISTVYALATFWLLLKVPGAMNTSTHLESKAHTMLHGLERSAKHALLPAHHARAPARHKAS
ncbi:MAG: hypothetical protein JF887_07360 [Candidatus Dormibacteraeota bacterium]|uniref:Type IV secretion system protein n=1 Tax=Candidatus Amunia macphersoniae TaxID=3127014 RepID=A0A934KGV0_9BACT|nr:hypothetical protein [Candidatus Dormibacteraeota bacterium]